ncbi:MAG: MIP family channel protein [Candidatus Adiutrix sp.]|jgi:MIP family channel proteins|nr:MIP family channel protein [Candidatus Adiutrix sp.]
MRLRRELLAEFSGTFLLVFFGLGAVHAAVLSGAQAGLWQVAIVWGVAVALAIYAFGAASGAHLNPAMTVAFAAFRGFPRARVAAYCAAQLLGAFAAAALLYSLFQGLLSHFETAQHLVRGGPGSQMSAMVYGQYFPHPGLQKALGWADEVVSLPAAMGAELVGTALLAFFVFAVTDPHNQGGPGRALLPLFIGLSVSILISVLAPLSQAGFNPARDFGPRLFSWLAGWGAMAIPGPRGGFFTVYILSPLLGGLAGGFLYETLTRYGKQERSEIMTRPRLIIVGGFLGAGKTTLLGQARQLLEARGLRVGLITNDQAPGLVDTARLDRGDEVQEVSGSCFCCNFNGFVAALKTLAARGREVILAEPVGSCTDLSATILQPLKDLHRQDYRLAPFTVLLDPGRAGEILNYEKSPLHRDALYILGRQLAEADRILLNKADLLSAGPRENLLNGLRRNFPQALVTAVSALDGQGVELWLEECLSADPAKSGRELAAVDYDRYAHGEAVLGWLNLTAEADWSKAPEAPAYLADFLARLRDELVRRSLETGHVKALLSTPQGQYIGSLIDNRREAAITKISGTPGRGPLIVNARVECEPEVLEEMIRQALDEAGRGRVALSIKDLHCLKPGRPNPTHRYSQVVQ